ncbi:SDR family oxidoreductase [Alphaproteobacteria bacterium KMM 3653]|uniref:SDR family oxidoreductase n=1 Tax=Harenicola maris TaxID=2841044 RepID=A0AAP2CRF5_9RHOB|nr:SDR family oxidoreductase [Harenicola maris]
MPADQTTPLAGQRAVITGASRGLGRAMAVALAAQGMSVAVTGRDEAAMQDTLTAIQSVGGTGTAHSLDVTEPDAPEALAAKLWQEGPVDVVIANAGISLVKPAIETSDEDFMQVINANVLGTFVTLRAFGERMHARGQGKLLATSSDIGIRGSAGWVAYAASKGAINAMVKTLAWEWAPKLTVNAIAPGAFATDINSHLLSQDAVMQAICADTPLARVGRAEEIGPLTAFLAGPGSDFMTGQILSLDGGIQKS